jgi:hypothetical protein
MFSFCRINLLEKDKSKSKLKKNGQKKQIVPKILKKFFLWNVMLILEETKKILDKRKENCKWSQQMFGEDDFLKDSHHLAINFDLILTALLPQKKIDFVGSFYNSKRILKFSPQVKIRIFWNIESK